LFVLSFVINSQSSKAFELAAAYLQNKERNKEKIATTTTN